MDLMGNVVISDKLFYLHKGLVSNKWKEYNFAVHSNGKMSKIENGKIKRSIDLKNVFKYIGIKSASDLIVHTKKCANQAQQQHSQPAQHFKSSTSLKEIFNGRKSNLRKFKSNNNSLEIDDVETTDFSNALLMEIPVKLDFKTKWVIMFKNYEQLTNWMSCINKWSVIPKILIDFVELPSQSDQETVEEFNLI